MLAGEERGDEEAADLVLGEGAAVLVTAGGQGGGRGARPGRSVGRVAGGGRLSLRAAGPARPAHRASMNDWSMSSSVFPDALRSRITLVKIFASSARALSRLLWACAPASVDI